MHEQPTLITERVNDMPLLLAQMAPRGSPFNIGIAGRAARTSTNDRHSRIRCLEAVLLYNRIEIGRGNVSTHVESPGPEGIGVGVGHPYSTFW